MNANDVEPAAEGGLSTLIRTLRRRWVVVLIPALLVPCVAAAYALSRDDEYSATASVLFRSTPGSDFRLSGAQDEERESATNVSLASLGQVAKRTAAALGSGVTSGTVAQSVETSADGTANLLSIKATNPEQDLVARLANEYAKQFVAFRRNADRRTVREAQNRSQRRLDVVQRRLNALRSRRAAGDSGVGADIRNLVAERNQLQDETRKLSTLGTLTSGNVEIAQRASAPGAPSSSGPLPITLLGLGLGVLLGIGLALLFEVLDRRLRDTSEIEQAFNRPTLGAIPLSPALERGRRKARGTRGKGRAMGPGEMEAFHMLRANLRYFEADRAVNSVVVTSAAPGEGKSTVAWNLAAANANAGNRVLLIEAELRRPTFVQEFKLQTTKGLIHILADGADPSGVVVRLPVSSNPANGDGPHGTMDVIAAGGIPPNPTDLLGSDRMAQLIAMAEQRYDLVVIDTPPVSVVSDAIPIMKATDGVIVVSLIGVSSRDAAAHLRKQLESLGVNFLGVVINGISSADGYYGSVYGYAERYEAAGQPVSS